MSSHLFGATDGLKAEANNLFRRMEEGIRKHKRAFRVTGEHTIREALDRRKAAATAESSAVPEAPATWCESWLRQEPTIDELLLATHGGRPMADTATVVRHVEERRKYRNHRVLRRAVMQRSTAPTTNATPPHEEHGEPESAPTTRQSVRSMRTADQ